MFETNCKQRILLLRVICNCFLPIANKANSFIFVSLIVQLTYEDPDPIMIDNIVERNDEYLTRLI